MANPTEQRLDLKAIRTDAILTTSYVAGTVLTDCEKYNQLMLFIKFTKGSLTSFQIKVEFSDDGETFYQQTFESIAGGVSTLSAGVYSATPSGDQNYILAIPIKCSSVKIWAKGTGTVTSSSLQIKAGLGVA